MDASQAPGAAGDPVSDSSFIGSLNRRYFDGALPADALELMRPIDEQGPEVQTFVERIFRLMRSQELGAADFAELVAWMIGTFAPRLLPDAWAGAVPPVTLPGRHSTIDEYLVNNPWRAVGDDDELLDLGCGFPPLTAVETAERLPHVRVTAADPSLGRYLVREPNGDYACFDADAELLFFQPGALETDRWEALYADPAGTRARFSDHLRKLRRELPVDARAYANVERDGITVSLNPVLEFTRENLTFEERGIGADGWGPFTAVRCFNVLLYFDRAFRRRTLEWLTRVVADGGIFVEGANWALSRYSRYMTYQSENGRMRPKEFAFGIESVRSLHVITWYALHDDELNALAAAELIGALRSEKRFCADLDGRMDEILAEIGFCARREDGCLGTIGEDADHELLSKGPDMLARRLEAEGFPARAVESLRAQGYDAWVNCVGHVAVDPAGLDCAGALA